VNELYIPSKSNLILT